MERRLQDSNSPSIVFIPKFTCIPASQASINPDEILHRNIAMVQWNGEIVPIPAPIIRMVWFTDSANKTGVQWQEGEKTVIMLDGTGIGETYLDDWLDVYIKAEQKKGFLCINRWNK